MKNKTLMGLIAGATIGTAIATPVIMNTQNTEHIVNKVLMVSNINNTKTNEAVVINGNSNMNLYALFNGTGIVSNLSTGEMLTILGQSQNGYCKVRVQETGAVGYINIANMQDILNGTNDSFTQFSRNGRIVNVSSNVRLRSNPTIGNNIIGHLINGTSLNILGKQGQWYKVNANGQVGFIYEEYVSTSIINSNSNNQSLANNINTNSGNTGTSTTSLNSSNYAGVTNSNSKVKNIVVRTKNSVMSNSSDSIGKTTKLTTSSSTQSPSSKESVRKVNKYEYIATDCNNVPIMSEPNTSSSVLDRLVSQSKVYVYSESNGWDYVEYNGVKGYIFGEEIQPTQVANSNSNIPILVYRTGYIPSSFKDGVIVEKKPNSHGGEITKLYPGDSFYVMMECDGWASVQVDLQHGYIKTSEITYAAPTSVQK